MALLKWNLDYMHAFNSFEGYRYFYYLLKQRNGSWIDYAPHDKFLQEFSRYEARLAAANSAYALNMEIRNTEQFLTDWNLNLPLYREANYLLLAPYIRMPKSGQSNFTNINCE